MTVLQAIGFMVLGGVIVEVFETHAWRRYQQGRKEGASMTYDPNHRGGSRI